MHQSLRDYFWFYIVASVVLFGATIYLMPKLLRFMERIINRRQSRRAKKNGPGVNAEKNKNRYRTF